jgi:glycosyltransferase involved in cell wall biosynthesis
VSDEIRLSVTIITKNEAHRIERCLRSVAFADERVVLDSGSTDDTVAIATRCGARVESTRDWPGFGPQKNRAVALARGQWVFSIDADEEANGELADSIRAAIAAPAFDGYWVRRVSTFCGRTIRFGDWRRDRVLRLFRKSAGRFSDDVVHERVVVAGQQGELQGWLAHESVESYEDGRQKMLRYARLGAARLRDRGKGGLASALVHGGWTFVRGYLFRLGLLDGRYGLTIARLNAEGTYLRYRLAGRSQSAIESQDP